MRKGYKVEVSLDKEKIKRKLKPLKKLKFKSIKKSEIEEEKLSKAVDIVNNNSKKQEDLRKDRIGKTLVEVKNEILDIEREKRLARQRRRKIYTICFVVLLLCIVYLIFHYGPIVGISLNKAKNISNSPKVDFTSNDDDIYLNYNEELLVYNSNKVVTYNKHGKVTWEYSLNEIFVPKIYVSGKYMAITNNSTNTIYLFEDKKELLTKKIDGTLSAIYLNDNGKFAVEYMTNGSKKVVNVFNTKGEVISTTSLEVSSIIDIKFINNSNKLLLLCADLSSFNVGCSIKTLDLQKSDENLSEIAKFENSMVYKWIYKSNQILLLLDDKIVSCNLNSNTTNTIFEFDNSQVLFIDIFKNYFTYIEKELNTTSNYNIVFSGFDLSQIAQDSIDSMPKCMISSGYLNYYIYQNNLVVLNKWGVEIKNIEIDFPPKDIVIIDKEKCVALIYSSNIIFLNI